MNSLESLSLNRKWKWIFDYICNQEGKYALLQYYCWSRLYSLESEMPLPGDPWLRVWHAWRRQFLRLQSFLWQLEKTAFTTQGAYIHWGRWSRPRQRPLFTYSKQQWFAFILFSQDFLHDHVGTVCPDPAFWLPACGLARQAVRHGSGLVRMRAPSPLATSQPFHLLWREKETYPLNMSPNGLSGIFKARTCLWEKKPRSSTHKEEFYLFPCLKHIHVNCPVGYGFVAELTWAIPVCINYYRINLACARAATPPTNVWIMQCKYISSWRVVLTWAPVCNPWQANKTCCKATPHGN